MMGNSKAEGSSSLLFTNPVTTVLLSRSVVARSRSPTEMCVKSLSLASCFDRVPLPAPGAPGSGVCQLGITYLDGEHNLTNDEDKTAVAAFVLGHLGGLA